MKKIAALVFAAMMASTPSAQAAESAPSGCKAATEYFAEARRQLDLSRGGSDVMLLYKDYYNASSRRCLSMLMETYKVGNVPLIRRTVFDPINKKLYALYQDDVGGTGMACEIIIDGTRANCLDEVDFERLIMKHYGVEAPMANQKITGLSIDKRD